MAVFALKFNTLPRQAASGSFEKDVEAADLASAEFIARQELKRLNTVTLKNRWNKPVDGVKWQITSVKEATSD